jgi:hypothetical protein
MRPSWQHSYRLPLVVSLLLHGGLIGGLIAYSTTRAAAPDETVDTRRALPAGTIVFLPDDGDGEGRAEKAPGQVREDGGPKDTVVRLDPLPPAKSVSADNEQKPTVSAPAAVAANPSGSTHGGSAEWPGGAGNAGGSGCPGGLMFAAAPTATKVVYVVDRSGSMGQRDAYRRACGEVIANLGQWPTTAKFQVVPYNSSAQPLCVNRCTSLLPLNSDTLQQAAALLAKLPPTGWTDHLCALKQALALSPDVLYLVTDADDLKAEDVRTITNLNHGKTVIHTIEMQSRYAPPPSGALARLATSNQGTFRRVLLED